MLILGFIWCLYFLVLALVDPAQAEYANNLSEMIVGLLTIISIRLRVLRVSAAWTIKDKKSRQSAGVFEKNDRFPEFTASSGNRLGSSFTE